MCVRRTARSIRKTPSATGLLKRLVLESLRIPLQPAQELVQSINMNELRLVTMSLLGTDEHIYTKTSMGKVSNCPPNKDL